VRRRGGKPVRRTTAAAYDRARLLGVHRHRRPAGHFTQAGYVVGLALLVPLGDLHERGKVVGTVMSGLLIGILSARIISGIVAQLLGWRVIFVLAAGAMVLLAAVSVAFMLSAPPGKGGHLREGCGDPWAVPRQPGMHDASTDTPRRELDVWCRWGMRHTSRSSRRASIVVSRRSTRVLATLQVPKRRATPVATLQVRKRRATTGGATSSSGRRRADPPSTPVQGRRPVR
jgi:MFS family permease